jgi:hypothetical protein
MGIFRRLVGSGKVAMASLPIPTELSPKMSLEFEKKHPIVNPTDEQIREAVLALAPGGSTYGSLTDEVGNYVQVGGGRPWSMVEWRQVNPVNHCRAYTETNIRRPYKDGGSIHFTAGPVQLKEDEWLLLKQAAEIFVAFNQRQPFPDFARWRSVHNILGLKGTGQ